MELKAHRPDAACIIIKNYQAKFGIDRSNTF